MPTETPPKDAVSDAPIERPSASEIFSALAHDRRRYVLHYLTRRVGAVPLSDLGEAVALWEGEPTADRYERVLTGLYHRHLPSLAERGFLGYDLEREQVWIEDGAEAVRPYLDLAVEDDIG